jgi:hypothetical protein
MRSLLTLAGITAMIAMAAPAYADSNDDEFLALLQAAGISFPSPDRVIATGRLVCKLADQGKQMVDVVNTIQSSNPGLHGDNAARFTAIAVDSYCPNRLGQ